MNWRELSVHLSIEEVLIKARKSTNSVLQQNKYTATLCRVSLQPNDGCLADNLLRVA